MKGLSRSTSALLLLVGGLPTATAGSTLDARAVELRGCRSATAAATGRSGNSPVGDGAPFRISPDGQYVVREGTQGLFSMRLPDEPWMQLAPPSSCWDVYDEFLITDDSQTVLFTCPEAPPGAPRDLWAVPIGGPASAAVLLSAAPDDPVGVNGFFSAISASRVFYGMNRLDPQRIDLYSVPVEGPASEGVVINGALGEWGMAGGPFPLQSSSRVIYHQWRPAPGSDDIWMTDLAAPNAVPIGISPPSHPFGGYFQVAPDEQHVVWPAGDQNYHSWIYSAPISDPPGATIQLNADMPASGRASIWAISPDSARVAYRANPNDPVRYELFSVPIGGPASSAVNLSASAQAWDPIVVLPEFSPDSGWILYSASREVENRMDLYRVPAMGPASANLRINPVEEPPLVVRGFELVPGATDVVFAMVGPDPYEPFRCYRGSWLGASGNATPLWTEPLGSPGVWIDCDWVAESRGVLAVGRELSSPWRALWLAHGDGPPDLRPKKLLDAEQFEQGMDPFSEPNLEMTPDSKYVVFIATPLGGKEDLWVLPLPFFWDGFESGGTAQWSAAQP